MRRVYEVKGTVTHASGMLALFVKDKPVEGTVAVDGTKDDFDVVVGRTFVVSGELVRAPGLGGMDIAATRFVKTEVKVDSRSCFVKLRAERLTASVLVEISDDGRRFNRVELTGSPTSLWSMLKLSCVTVSGEGKMVSEE